MKKLSFDLGNFTTIGVDENDNEIIFESRFLELGEDEIDDFDSSEKLEYDGKIYRYQDGTFDAKNEKIQRENILLNFAAGLAKLAEDGDTVDVVVGVPIRQYKGSRSTIIDLIMKDNTYNVALFNNESNKREKTVTINSVTVVPEAIGAYYALSDDIVDKKGRHDLILVDIGGKTIDACTIDKNCNIIKNNTYQRGAFDFYENIMNKINADFPDAVISIEEVQEIIEDGLFISGEVKKYNDYAKKLLEKECIEVIKILDTYDKKYARAMFVISGGHGKTLFPYIHSKIDHAILHNDPVMANAKGYLEYLLEKEEVTETTAKKEVAATKEKVTEEAGN